MAREVAERGAGNVSVAHVVARSGVSRRTFYEVFEDREDCFLAAFDEAVARVAAVVVPAYERRGSWQARMRAALTALLELLDDDRGTGRLLVVESLGAGPLVFERRRRVLEPVLAAIDRAREQSGAGDGPPPLTAESVLGGALSIVHARLLQDSPGATIDLLNPLMSMIVLPYQGAAAARRELERPAAKTRRGAVRDAVPADPLRELEMRLTYRTIRVLTALAAHPGASNRVIGEESGIADQGQISKLLARLQGLGLIENTRSGFARGEANAWTLTPKGWDIHTAIT